jgi:hypothetical protein
LLLKESLAMQRELGDQQGIAACLEGLATVACADGQPERAARLSGAPEALGVPIATPLPPGERAHCQRHLAAARAALGEAAFVAAWAEGRAMTSDDAIEYAFEPSAASSVAGE